MHPPSNAPVQVFPLYSTGVYLTKPEMLEHLKAKLAAIRSACDQGGDLIAGIFGIAPKQCQEFADAVNEALIVGLPQQIEYLENLKEPEPLQMPSGPWFGGYKPTIEQLADAQMNADNWQQQLDQIEAATNGRDIDPAMKAALNMGTPMIKQQLQDAIRRRDQLQTEMEAQAAQQEGKADA